MEKIMRNSLHVIFLSIFMAIIFLLSVRGYAGNPTMEELNTTRWIQDGPFELSPERGRYALAYSLIEDKSFYFSLPVARFATPDLGYINGKFVSLFAPAVSFIIMPGYIIGEIFGIGQVGAFSVISLFAILNALLINALVRFLGGKNYAANIASIIFVFASPAFAYGVTLYQHHISTFLILSALYCILRFNSWWSLLLVWILFAASIPVDYPNLILMLPIALVATTRIIWIKTKSRSTILNISPLRILTPFIMILPLLFYVWFSQNSYGTPFQLSGTILSISALDEKGNPTLPTDIINKSVDELQNGDEKNRKTAVSFFQTRNLLNGFYIHILSPDRGILYFTPVMLFSILGGLVLWKKRQKELAIISGIIGGGILLYSMWGDPWGGWAFGSRYLIPTYALASVLIGLAFTKFSRSLFFMVPFFVVALYSVGVNTLGALTANTNPPRVQILELEAQTKKVERFSFDRNFQYLQEKGSKSYIYNTFLKQSINPQLYYLVITSVIVLVLGELILFGFLRVRN